MARPQKCEVNGYINDSEKIIGIEPPIKGIYWRKSSIPGIMVSECGDLWDTKKGRFPAIYKVESGHLVIGIKVDGVIYKEPVSKLVYEAFCGKIPKGQIVAHKDGIKSNDDLENLMLIWKDNHKESGSDIKQTIINELRKPKPRKKKTNDRQLIVYVNGAPAKTYDSVTEYSQEKHLNYTTLWNYLNGKSKKPRVITEDVRYGPKREKVSD